MGATETQRAKLNGPAWAAIGLIIAAAVLAYANSLTGPFLFDDEPAITENPTIRRLWPPGPALSPPDNGSSVMGRPLVNLSFAINYAIGGENPVGYHGFNLLIHVLAGLTLYGVVRRTLRLPGLARSAEPARRIACGAALWWVVHPLQTESVTAIVQRTESLMGLFLLVTLYAFIRAAAPGASASRRWMVFAGLACLAGMACKEVMVVAPVLVLLYDRTFLAGSFAGAVRHRGRWHLLLAATWIPLVALVLTSGERAIAGVSPWQYLLTQCAAITRYLGLALWPHPLVADYGTGVVGRWQDVLPQALLLVVLAVATVWAVWRRPSWGFLGAWFFVLLAPSSSVVPLATQTMAEHRMYLPLAAITAAGALGVHAWLGRRSLALFVALAVLGGWQTWNRNRDYRSEFALWTDTTAKAPDNARAWNNLGRVQFHAGLHDAALAHFQRSLELNPAVPEVHYNLGLEYEWRQRPDDAERHYREAIRLKPAHVGSRLNLCALLIETRRLPEALRWCEETARVLPENAQAHINLGVALMECDRASAAIAPLETAVRLAPDDAKAHGNLANAFALNARAADAFAHYEAALQLDPNYGTAHDNYARLLLQSGQTAAAVHHFEIAVRLDPTNAGRRTRLEAARQLWTNANQQQP